MDFLRGPTVFHYLMENILDVLLMFREAVLRDALPLPMSDIEPHDQQDDVLGQANDKRRDLEVQPIRIQDHIDERHDNIHHENAEEEELQEIRLFCSRSRTPSSARWDFRTV